MDATVVSVIRLFDEILAVLNRHQNEPGVVEVLEYLKAARYNYAQRDIDRMILSLLLAMNDFPKLGPEVTSAIQQLIHGVARLRSEVPARMANLAQEYQSRGGKLLSLGEALEEVSRRRGSSD